MSARKASLKRVSFVMDVVLASDFDEDCDSAEDLPLEEFCGDSNMGEEFSSGWVEEEELVAEVEELEVLESKEEVRRLASCAVSSFSTRLTSASASCGSLESNVSAASFVKCSTLSLRPRKRMLSMKCCELVHSLCSNLEELKKLKELKELKIEMNRKIEKVIEKRTLIILYKYI
jgi:hypothetical protein